MLDTPVYRLGERLQGQVRAELRELRKRLGVELGHLAAVSDDAGRPVLTLLAVTHDRASRITAVEYAA